MSQKWRRSQAWDDANIPVALWPLKLLLRTFSSIWLAVTLLGLVALYGILASVPIGLIAQAPTYLIDLLTLVASVVLAGVLPAWIVTRPLQSRASRFVVGFATALALGALGAWAWVTFAWPRLHYDPVTGRGLMLFAEFVQRNKAITWRRIPGMEMSELEFYGWWPLRLILMLFVINLMTATVRRIEFTFRNIGVLTVHTGIITIALGSIYYNGLKQEGDTVLLAGNPDASGEMTPGPPVNAFFDNTRVALFVDEMRGWDMRPLSGVPRYNDYNLNAVGGVSVLETIGRASERTNEPSRALSVPVPGTTWGRVDPDIRFRIVGYASYADGQSDWVRNDGPVAAAPRPMRIVHLIAPPEISEQIHPFYFPISIPAERWSGNEAFTIEYTAGMSEQRWRDLSEKLPDGSEHALVIETPATDGRAAFRGVYPVNEGGEVVLPGGEKVKVKQLAQQPPFPIITEGYRGASSSMAVVTITPREGTPFDRWVYHRYPEIDQDLLQELNERGMPRRRAPDSSIRVALVEADRLHIYLNESGGATRAIVRQPGGAVRIVDAIAGDELPEIVPKVSLKVVERWADATPVERPQPVPEEKRDRNSIGTHEKAWIAVEVSIASGARVVWLPFTKYMDVGMGTERAVTLPDGRTINLAFGRLRWSLPNFEVELVDFQMIAYDHRGSPRDYQSMLRVSPIDGSFEPFEHVTQLNTPLRAPFHWDDRKFWGANALGSLVSGLSSHQYKFSQAGWDRAGWEQSQKLVDAGRLRKPRVAFTILGVGNNPGIHIIAAGGVLMGLGIPWAFYVKPLLVRREKRKIQEQLAAGTYRRPGAAAETELVGAKA